MSRVVRFFTILGVGLLVLNGAVFVLLSNRTPPAEVFASKVASSGEATIGGPFTLVGTDGSTITDQTYRGEWMLIYFGYTFCPDACPTALANMSGALAALGRSADHIQPLFITVDPARDTREALADYLQSFDPRIVGLTGSAE